MGMGFHGKYGRAKNSSMIEALRSIFKIFGVLGLENQVRAENNSALTIIASTFSSIFIKLMIY